MNCDDIHALLEGGPSAVQAAPEARRHLEACAACREYAAGMRAEDARLAGALRAVAVDERRFARVKAGLRRRLDERDRGRLAPARRGSVWRAWVPVAAALVLALSAYLIFQPTRPGPDDGRVARETREPGRPAPALPAPPPEKPVQDKAPSWPATWTLPKDLAELQSRLRGLHLLDDLHQVQVVMRSLDDAEGLGIAEDAELYLERIFALNPNDPDLCRDVLTGVREARMGERLRGLKERWRAPDAERVVRTLDAGDWALGVALQPTLASLQSLPPDEAAFSEAERVFRKRDYHRALDLYRSFSEERPKDRRVPLAQHASAFILQKKLKEPAEARKTYQRMAKEHGREPLAQSAWFHIAETFEDDGRVDNALEQYGAFLDLAPKHPRATEANRRAEALRRKQKGEPVDQTWGQMLLQKEKKKPREDTKRL